MVNKPARGIGGVTLNAVEDIARQKSLPFLRAGMEVPKVKPFCEMIVRLSAQIAFTDAHDMAMRIADESGLYAFYKADTSIEGLARIANLDELMNSTAVFVEERQEEAMDADEFQEPGAAMPVFTLDDYVENVSLLSSVDVDSEENDDNKVALMTVHSAKGLEFPYVFVAGLEENLFPSMSMTSSLNDVEEERRLFYVAMTRAKKAVTLSFAGTRMRNGKHESNAPSRFIREIDQSYIENPLPARDFDNSGVTHEWGGFGSRFTGGRLDGFRAGAESRTGAAYGSSGRYGRSGAVTYEKHERRGAHDGGPVGRPGAAAPSARPAAPPVIDPDFKAVPMTELRAGERVEHIRFGAGEILEISGRYPDMKARIRFDEHGEKLLLLKYAKLRHCK